MSVTTIKFKWVKELPIKQINKFEDRVVYNVAVFTREYTKATDAYPYLTGKLARSEMAKPIRGYNNTYSLLNGTDYDVYVWNMKDVNWTNKRTKPQWYFRQFRQSSEKIVNNAVSSALKEI